MSMDFKNWLASEEWTDTQRIAVGGKNRAIRNDMAISYDPQTNSMPSHKYSDEILPDNIMPWIVAMHNKGYDAAELSVKLRKYKKIKASPETIQNKLNVERAKEQKVVPTLRKKKLGDITQPTTRDDYINSFYTISPEAQALIVQWSQMGMPASVIHKNLKHKGIEISYRVLLNALSS